MLVYACEKHIPLCLHVGSMCHVAFYPGSSRNTRNAHGMTHAVQCRPRHHGDEELLYNPDFINRLPINIQIYILDTCVYEKIPAHHSQ